MKMVKCEPGYKSVHPAAWQSPFAGMNFFNESAAVFSRPAVNVKETPENFTIELAAPGLSKEDFKINVEKNVLKISSQKEKSSETETEQYTRKEFSFSSFERSFRLPETILGENITAKYENGILGVMLPKKDEAKEKPVKEISVS